MAEQIRINQANMWYPGWKNYPNIHSSGSLRGMRDRFGWDLDKVVRVGSYYYHLKGHPNVR